MPESINSKLKEQYDHDDSGGSLDTNLGDFLDSEGASGTSNNSKWRDWASGTGTSLNTRLFHKHGGSGSFMTRWKNWIAFSSTHSFNFDGSNDYLELNGTLESVFQGAFTISAWIKPDDGNPSGINALFGSDSTGDQDRFRVMLKTDGKIGLLYRSNAGTAIDADSTSAVFSDGATDWTHIAVTLSQSGGTVTGTIYINGSSIAGSFSSSQTMSNFATTTNFVIGGSNRAGSLTQYFDGLIDEVALWDVALSSSDITSIYNNGKVIDLSKSASYGTDRTGNLKLWLRCGDKAEPESTTAIARQDFYTDFDGTDDFIQIEDDDSLDITGSWTCLAWIKIGSGTSGYDRIIGKQDTSSNCNYGIGLQNGDEFGAFLNDGGGFNALYYTGALDVGEWYHVAGVWDTSKLYVYVDGQLKATSSDLSSANSSVANNGELLIGVNQTNGAENFKGQISSASVYQTRLDAQTISQMAKSRFTPMRDNRFSVVDFDGTNDRIDVSATLSNATYTVMGWVYKTRQDGAYFVDFRKDSGTGYFAFGNNSNNSIYAQNGTLYVNGVTGTTVPLNAWTHICVTGMTIESSTIKIACQNNDTNFFQGSYSSVSVYSGTKTAEEVYALYQKGITYNESSESGLVGYWRMGDGAGDTFKYILDQSSNNNNGAMTNMTRSDISEQMVAGYDLGAFTNSTESTLENVYNSDMSLSTTPSFNGVDFSYYSNTSSAQETSTIGGRTNVWKIVTGSSDDTYSAVKFVPNPNQDISNKQFNISVKVYIPSTDGVPSARLRYIYDSGGNATTIATTTTTDEWVTLSTSSPVTIADYNGWSLNIEFVSSGVANKICYIDDYSITSVLQSEVSDTYPLLVDVNNPVISQDLQTGNWNQGGMQSDGITWGDYVSANGFRGKNDASGEGNNDNAYGDEISFTAGKTYKMSFTLTVNSGSIGSIFVGVTSGTDGSADSILPYTLISSTGDYSYNFTPTSTVTRRPSFRFVVNGTYDFTISNFELIEYEGNTGVMTNQASSDLVYSSVLPDQSFLTGVNSAYNFIDLDGSNEYIDCGTSQLHTLSATTFTISCWIKVDNVSSDMNSSIGSLIADAPALDPTNGGFWLAYDDRDGTHSPVEGIAYNIKTSAGYQRGKSNNNVISSGVWHHIALVLDGQATLYIDGTSSTNRTEDNSGTLSTQSNELTIGSDDTNTYNFNGEIAQSAVWSKALSSTEVSAIYTVGRHGNLLDSYSDNLLGYWAMSALDAKTGLSDMGDGTIYDRSGNSNHGTATNTESADLKSSPNAQPEGYAKGDTNRSTTTP